MRSGLALALATVNQQPRPPLALRTALSGGRIIVGRAFIFIAFAGGERPRFNPPGTEIQNSEAGHGGCGPFCWQDRTNALQGALHLRPQKALVILPKAPARSQGMSFTVLSDNEHVEKLWGPIVAATVGDAQRTHPGPKTPTWRVGTLSS